jgi:FkbM family methyltransferase
MQAGVVVLQLRTAIFMPLSWPRPTQFAPPLAIGTARALRCVKHKSLRKDDQELLKALRNLVTSGRFLIQHPLAGRQKLRTALRIARWQFGSRVLKSPIVMSYVNGTQLVVERGMHAATANLYFGLSDFADMGFLLHLLRQGDLMVDVGANVGTYTVLAASTGANVIAIEPLPSTRQHLERNIALNAFGAVVEVVPCAMGSKRGHVRITSDLGTMNHILRDQDDDASALLVAVRTLDDVVGNQRATVIKIDVEGHELEVLKGAVSTLSRNDVLAVIAESNDISSHSGVTESVLKTALRDLGFHPYSYDPFTRELSPRLKRTTANVLFVRRAEDIVERLKGAPRFRIYGHAI